MTITITTISSGIPTATSARAIGSPAPQAGPAYTVSAGDPRSSHRSILACRVWWWSRPPRGPRAPARRSCAPTAGALNRRTGPSGAEPSAGGHLTIATADGAARATAVIEDGTVGLTRASHSNLAAAAAQQPARMSCCAAANASSTWLSNIRRIPRQESAPTITCAPRRGARMHRRPAQRLATARGRRAQ
jgi:hypothetical protein